MAGTEAYQSGILRRKMVNVLQIGFLRKQPDTSQLARDARIMSFSRVLSSLCEGAVRYESVASPKTKRN